MNAWEAIRHHTADEHGRFLVALKTPAEAQRHQLEAILRANRNSAIGRQYGFETLGEIDAYRRRVPIHRYGDFRAEIERMATGDAARLCTAPVVAYEETGGSSSAAKLVPYTLASLHAFRRALYPWLSDLLDARPGIADGRCYWPVSPSTRAAAVTLDGTPIGLSSDAEYFGARLAAKFARLSATPPELGALREIETWRYLTLRCLLDADDLSLISIWSPTFLTPLLDALTRFREQLVTDVARGTVGGPAPADAASLSGRFAPRPARAEQIASALSGAAPDTAGIWPNLDTISCWTDAGAARFVGALRDAFPQARIQGKGLLATEAVVSIPLASFPHPVLAVNSGFYEFIDSAGESALCEELRENQSYRVVVTTHGGLYRYDTGDQVRMRGRVERAPMLEFVGRGGLVSDLCGEKLTEPFVSERLPRDLGFVMLAPTDEPQPHYVLIVDAECCDEHEAAALARSVDESLRANPHYRYARRLGQLESTEAARVRGAMSRYVEFGLEARRTLGDIKPAALHASTDLARYLSAHAEPDERGVTRRPVDRAARAGAAPAETASL